MLKLSLLKRSFMAGGILFGLASATVWAGGPARDTFSFSESQKDSLSCSNTSSESCMTYTTGKVSAKVLFFAANPAPLLAIVDLSDEVDLVIGDWEFDNIIGNGRVSRTTSTFTLTDQDCSSGPCVTHAHGTVQFKISTKGLAVSVKTATGATANEQFESSVIANEHADDNAPFTDAIPVRLIVTAGDQSITDSFTIAVSGTATTKPTNKNGSTFNLNAVKVKSTGFLAD